VGVKRLVYGLKHSLGVLQHFIVPEPQNREPLTTQPDIPPLNLSAVQVLAAIHFDHQPRRQANEIHDVRPHGLLAAELVAVQIPQPQLAP
jgi:hypothetical protein